MEGDKIENNIEPLETTDDIKEEKEKKEKYFPIINSVIVRYSIALLILPLKNFMWGIIVQGHLNKVFIQYKIEFLALKSIIFNLIFSVLLIFILIKSIKKKELEKHSYSCKKYLVNLFINSGLSGLGTFLGNVIHFLLLFLISRSKSKGKFPSLTTKTMEAFEEDKLRYVLKGTSNNYYLFLQILVICIGYPITKELIFRKFLVERLALYSKTLAVFASGIIFGIFHLKLSKLFSTMFVGWFYAYTYEETHNLLIPISFHMYNNLWSLIIQRTNASNAYKPKITNIYIMINILKFIEFFVGICLFTLNRREMKIKGEEKNSVDKWKLFKSCGFKLIIIEGIAFISLPYILLWMNH